jgi:hypothetical protein
MIKQQTIEEDKMKSDFSDYYTTTVHDLASDKEFTYRNDKSPEFNLITTYMIESNLGTSLSDSHRRNLLQSKIQYGEKSISLGDYAVLR